MRRVGTKRRTVPWRDWGQRIWKWLQALRKPKKRRSQIRLGKAAQKKRQARPLFSSQAASRLRATVQVNGNLVCNMLFLALIGWALIWFFVSDQFYVGQIEVVGNERVSIEAIRSASGLQDYNIFWVNARQAAAQIVQALPPVQEVRVQYGLPNVVKLVITEQGNQVMWQIAGNRYWVDQDGQLHPAGAEAKPSILVQDIRPNLPDRVDPQAVAGAIELIALLPDTKVIEYGPITGLRFVDADGWTVYLGTGEDMARKIDLLNAIAARFADPEQPQPTLIDLRFPDSPYYRLPSEEGGE